MTRESKIENAVIVRNKTRLEQLTEKFNTTEQAKFYVQTKQAAYFSKKSDGLKKGGFNPPVKINQKAEKLKTANDFSQYEEENQTFYSSLNTIRTNLEGVLKTKVIYQDFLANYIFSDNDLVIVLGQDGLVANTAKYVHGIPIIAINPDELRYDGVLLPFVPDTFMNAVHQVLSGTFSKKNVTMAEVKLNDGQRLLAFNDFFIGISSHSSARYQITFRNQKENHSSSGIIVSTGAGSTGWMSSLFNMANGMIRTFSKEHPIKYEPINQEEETLLFVVREPFVSKTSQANITAGRIYFGEQLTVESFMPQKGIIFSDGIQSDFLEFNSGAIAEIGIAREKAILVIS
jgi:NAD kinase